ncbi:hypothetical protein OAB00_04050, partial [Akkermansiaceae bacterium]|nr:hypothetical protein [Akkermansiaceae bacterium]
MLQKLGKFFCVITILALLDGYSVIFQSLAWTSMLYERVPTLGISEAIDTTFSGDQPCEKCL